MNQEVCFICESVISEPYVTVKEKGVKTLLECSKKRKELDHQRLLKNAHEVTVHDACRKKYTNEKLITAYVMRGYKDAPQPMAPVSAAIRSRTQPFDFKEHCFLCGKGITPSFIERQERNPDDDRFKTHKVMKLSVKHNMKEAAAARGDEWAQKIVERLSNENLDLVAADAWYHNSCNKKLYKKSSGEIKGRKPASYVDKAMETIFSYLEEHSEECQFAVDELLNLVDVECRPDVRTIKSRLFKKYGNDVLYVERGNRSPVICFINVGHKILSDSFYENRKKTEAEERIRVVKAAAEIVLQDIRSIAHDTQHYPPVDDNFLSSSDSVIPATLLAFLQTVVITHKRGDQEKWRKKVVALSHAIISAARPSSFLSPILIGISVYLYKKFGSRLLIDLLSSLGFSASYWEAIRFETSCVLRSEKSEVLRTAFCQFVFDNADSNINTLDGLNTFHSMGGIMCITPHSAVLPEKLVERKPISSSAEVVRTCGNVQLQTCTMKEGLKNITVHDMINPNNILPSATDIVWLYGKWMDFPGIPGWNGFMEKATNKKEYARSKILYLPFINAPPSHSDTIYTSLQVAVQKCKELGQKSCIVTFDQPLYIKAMDIVHSGDPSVRNVIVRLGGFHLLMSFMGCIGSIMAGSGLRDAVSIIYAPNSVDKIMSGHAYGRAVRAHILTHSVLASLVWDTVILSDKDRHLIESMLAEDSSLIFETKEEFHEIMCKFNNSLEALEKRGPTSTLWVLYFKMVTLVKQFIEAERMGDWNLHLDTIQKMLPFFHAAGHIQYAKTAHLYVQEMVTLEEKMDPTEFDRFTREGYFTIRRSEKFWSGIWSDMTIEQTMMRSMKTSGGLTSGRGFTDSALAKWTQGMVHLQYVCDAIETYCEVIAASSEQHTDARPSRVNRDNNDSLKLKQWFVQHPPFPKSYIIMSISSGVIGGEQVNCQSSQDIGKACMEKMVGQNFKNLHLKRKDKVFTLADVTNTIKVGSEQMTAVDPMTLFQRISIAKRSDEDLKEYFTYELAPYPLSLFSEEGFRKGTKSLFYRAFKPEVIQFLHLKNKFVVVDGGLILHKVIWQDNESFGSICKKYVTYVKKHYGSEVIIVFDGYPSDVFRRGTKSSERVRRSKMNTSADIIFDEATLPAVSQEKFLGNERNKCNLICMLKTFFEEQSVELLQAVEDADVLIVNTALSKADLFDNVVVVSEDVDILVLLTGLSNSRNNIYFLKPGKSGKGDTYFSTSSYQYNPNYILLAHAFSGCDTTSSPFGHGKSKLCALIEKNDELKKHASIFYKSKATKEEISHAGEKLFMALYNPGVNTSQGINDLRYQMFLKMSTKTKINLLRLPPTLDAAENHAFRTFHQVQCWLGNNLDPVEWGWKRDSNGLIPNKMENDPAPKTLLQLIYCSCKKGCNSSCTCRKSGLNCTGVCKNCSGISCSNSPTIEIDEGGSDEDYTEVDEELNVEVSEKNGVESVFHAPETYDQPGPSKRQRLM